ncbi:response regulator transcription factor [Chloroflexota bacterium]
MSAKIRVLIVDDHDEVRRLLVKLLAQEEDMEIIGKCTNGKETLVSAALRTPDVIVMDVRMPIIDGIDAARMLLKKRSSCKVIIMTLYEQYLAEAMEIGVQGYLLKGINIDDLAESIRRVHRGEIVIDEILMSKVEA